MIFRMTTRMTNGRAAAIALGVGLTSTLILISTGCGYHRAGNAV